MKRELAASAGSEEETWPARPLAFIPSRLQMVPNSGVLEHGDLTHVVIGAAMRVHCALGPGFLESVYRNALAHELRRVGLSVQREQRLQVRYEGVVVGDFVADMLVAELVLVELKAASALVAGHELQLINYLAATGIEIGLLLNFGARRLEIRRLTRSAPSKRATG